jgi:hypothetical protein
VGNFIAIKKVETLTPLKVGEYPLYDKSRSQDGIANNLCPSHTAPKGQAGGCISSAMDCPTTEKKTRKLNKSPP